MVLWSCSQQRGQWRCRRCPIWGPGLLCKVKVKVGYLQVLSQLALSWPMCFPIVGVLKGVFIVPTFKISNSFSSWLVILTNLVPLRIKSELFQKCPCWMDVRYSPLSPTLLQRLKQEDCVLRTNWAYTMGHYLKKENTPCSEGNFDLIL